MIPNLLGKEADLLSLSPQIMRYVEKIDRYIVEREKTARQFIKRIAPNKAQSSILMMELDKHNPSNFIEDFIKPCTEGHMVGVISESGCPGIADPGALVVNLAHRKGIQVIPLVGPSSIFLALMSSGLNGQNFVFHGYLPIEKKEKITTIKNLEEQVYVKSQTQIFIETPYRNQLLFKDLISALKSHTQLCIASDITLPTERIRTQTVAQWRNQTIDLQKNTVVFLVGS